MRYAVQPKRSIVPFAAYRLAGENDAQRK